MCPYNSLLCNLAYRCVLIDTPYTPVYYTDLQVPAAAESALSSNLAQAEKEKSELQEQLKTLKEQFAATAATAEKETAALHKQLQVLSLLGFLVQKYKCSQRVAS